MTFVDANVFMYAVGRPHPLRTRARALLVEAVGQRLPLATSSAALLELVHAYVRTERYSTLDAALDLAEECASVVWTLEAEDVRLARALVEANPCLSARDLIHLACCRRRGVSRIMTFDRGLAAAMES